MEYEDCRLAIDEIRRTCDILKDRQRLKAVLLDCFLNDKLTVNTLMIVYDAGIVAEMQKAKYVSDRVAYQYRKQIEIEYGISRKQAKNAVCLWVDILEKEDPMKAWEQLYEYEEVEGGISISGFKEEQRKEIVIPTRVDGRDVVGISSHAFEKQNISKVVLPDSIRKIECGAFERCEELKEIKLPEGVVEIGKEAFLDCKGLEEVILPSTLKCISDKVFYGCESLQRISLPFNLETISNKSFYGCKQLRVIDIPDNVDWIGEEAFAVCEKLEKITFPESIKWIGQGAFKNCKCLHQIKLPTKLEEVEAELFKDCTSLEEVDLPEWTYSIQSKAFYGCGKLRSIEIPQFALDIGEEAFAHCDNLETVRIKCYPEPIEGIIRSRAFAECKKLQNIYIPVSVEIIPGKDEQEFPFIGCDNLEILCDVDSYAMHYAIENNIKYKIIQN